MHSYYNLSNRTVLKLESTTANSCGLFLNKLTTNNCLIPFRQLIYNFLLSPQGKYRADFLMWHENEFTTFIDIDTANCDSFIAQIQKFILREDIKISKTTLSVISTDKNTNKSTNLFQDPRAKQLPLRHYLEQTPNNNYNPLPQYQEQRIKLGIAEGIGEFVVDKSIILELLPQPELAIDFNKGCYIGQELITRTKFRGELRKMTAAFSVSGDNNIKSGEAINLSTGEKFGKIIAKHGNTVLVLVKIDVYNSDTKFLVAANGTTTTLTKINSTEN